MYKITIKNGADSFDCQEGDTIMRAALRAGIAFPYECNVGQCGSCRFEVLGGEVKVDWEDAPALTARDRRKGIKLGCQCQPLSDCEIKVRMDPDCLPYYTPEERRIRLLETRDITHDIREFRFRSEAAAEFKPGQYALFHLPGVEGPRAYSMCNQANADGDWHFLIKRVPDGAGSAYLFDELKPGNELPMDGPYGLAYLREDIPRDIVCVAGGSGLAPLIAITRAAALSPELAGRNIHFFFGGRGPTDICGEDYLNELSGYGERITYQATISVPELDPKKMWVGPVGFVHETVEQSLMDEFNDFEYYLAGPPPMLQATLQLLIAKYKVPVGQVHFDRFF